MNPLERIDEFRWRIPKSYKPGMRVDGIIYADGDMIEDIMRDKALDQDAQFLAQPVGRQRTQHVQVDAVEQLAVQIRAQPRITQVCRAINRPGSTVGLARGLYAAEPVAQGNGCFHGFVAQSEP